ncbi:MAG TPA: endopeptidase La [Methylomirabilota bacterium]|jgi:ATP-dependent Lon protease|nr:endopeptidase La [Methylomirabilota bacterium]
MAAETPAPAEFTIPDALPVLPVPEAVVFPFTAVPLLVQNAVGVKIIDDVMRGNRMLVFVAQRRLTAERITPEAVYGVGTVGVIHQMARSPDGSVRVMVQGVERVRVLDFVAKEPYLVARIQRASEQMAEGPEVDALRRAVLDLFRRLVEISSELPDDLAVAAETFADPRQVAYFVGTLLRMDTAARQALLEMDSVPDKLRRLVDVIQGELAVREMSRKITSDTEQRLNKKQREFILREQAKTIQKELGEEDGDDSELAELRRRLDEAGLSEEARREADRELKRLAGMQPGSPERGMIVSYLEWMASLPWNKADGGTIDIRRAREVLDEDHYDLDKIKDRILEYLAVRKLRQERRAVAEPPAVTGDPPAREPILCFAGPPGVGKTSLGQSIARALGRKFVRMSLGGVRDEAEIRGHRRTYIGAMPGRIIQGLRRAETKDPVFMLDEIDKIGADWRGDPASALLEVLDPAQNHTFMDNYLGVAFDLSQVLFIATGNALDTIPGPLRDRMEILQLSGYTDEEKVGIATQYLLPKQLAAHGLSADELVIEPDALRLIVRRYTREAGVRSLEREIAAIARKVARRIAEGEKGPFHVTASSVDGYLGRPRFFDEVVERTSRPGVATGLAWTPVGGDVLFVEVTMMPSSEERLVLTGMLGDVMRESAQAAVSYVWSNADAFDIDPKLFEGKTVHIHVPAGAIPKDGPSAGVTIVTALASYATRRPVRGDVAMTGEITLRGKVLPVGGIKEKVLAAHRVGVRTVILPRHNERDIEDVPAEVRGALRFVFADDAGDVVREALTPVATAAAAAG